MEGRRLEGLFVFAAASLLLLVLVSSAWVCDDAFISLRTALRFHEGDGLTWNPGERVQAFTHPLWLAVLLVFTGITREYFFTTIVVSLISTAAFVFVAARQRTASMVLPLLLALAASRAFVDFAVSGLENPLLALLLAVALRLAERAPSPRTSSLATLTFSGLFLVRPDAVLLGAPLWLAMHWRAWPKPWVVALGLSPAIAWELFSYLYYGAWTPNTALAKLNLDVPADVLWRSGAAYLGDSLTRDPVTLMSTAVCVAFVLIRGDRLSRALAVGTLASLLYVVAIGGDFMSGRFVMAPFVASLLAAMHALSVRPVPSRVLQLSAAVLLLAALAWPEAPARAGADFGEGYRKKVGPRGVVDERAYYFPWAGFLPVLRNEQARDLQPTYKGACLGRAFARSERQVEVVGETGMFGFFAGQKQVVDWFSLADPLLARIPYRTQRFRAGHYARPFPPGYFETRASGENRLVDPGLRAAWDDLVLVTRGPLFSSERWAALRRLNGGAHAEAFQRAAGNPPLQVPVPAPPPECAGW